MRYPGCALLATILLSGGLWGPTQAQATTGGDSGAVTDSVLVEMAAGEALSRAEAAPLARELGTAVHAVTKLGNGYARVELATALPVAQVGNAAEEFAGRADVTEAEPDLPVYAAQAAPVSPTDSLFDKQWGLWDWDPADGQTPPAGGYSVRAPLAWLASTGSADVAVAIIDSGITAHPDLPAPVSGYDFVSAIGNAADGDGRDPDPADQACGSKKTWHGTHVAGIVAAARNARGVVGVAPGVSLSYVRVLDCTGAGRTSDLADAITWASGGSVGGVADNPRPAQVINLSLSGKAASCPAYLGAAIEGAVERGVNVVVAAGNDAGESAANLPGNCPGTIVVAAVGRYGERAYYSNSGAGVDIAAPGGDSELQRPGEDAARPAAAVFSTYNEGVSALGDPGYAALTGTSMATPFVAGSLALLRSLHPQWTGAEAFTALAAAATPFPTGTGRDCTSSTCGAGIVDLGGAVYPRSGDPGALQGDVIADAPASVALHAIDLASGEVAATTTPTPAGTFTFPSLAPGAYALAADLPSGTRYWPDQAAVDAAAVIRVGSGQLVTLCAALLAANPPCQSSFLLSAQSDPSNAAEIRVPGQASEASATPTEAATAPDPLVSSAPADSASPEPNSTATPELPAVVVRLESVAAGKLTVRTKVTLTATVTDAAGSPVPEGSVEFRDSGHVLGSAPVAGGVATLQVKGLYGGAQAVTAAASAPGYLAGVASIQMKVADNTKPQARLRAVAGSAAQPRLTWRAGDEGGVAQVRVEVRRGSRWLPQAPLPSPGPGWVATTLAASQAADAGRACYRIQAQDFAGNRSGWVKRCSRLR
ncbi:MAG: S8 family serine peptidase [Candidatus Nanopelagicales bacterium]